jgi:hypothetical protein
MIPKAYGKERHFQDKGKSLQRRPPDITHTEFKEQSRTELPLFASVFTADITCTV